MNYKLRELEAHLEDSAILYLQDAFEENEGEAPCPHCVAELMIDEHQTVLLADMYSIGKDGKHFDLYQMLRSNLLTRLTQAEVYANALEQWKDLFAEEIENEMIELNDHEQPNIHE